MDGANKNKTIITNIEHMRVLRISHSILLSGSPILKTTMKHASEIYTHTIDINNKNIKFNFHNNANNT
ncbi:hypothetical protein EBL_c33120 [Shimwellia blattae DSM 4481 = NBRC 105725]|uniref:Uncharacterized protein n=1 Tax=Shimwellia blattae (strain ATCC 29907 / DSM 4481 / JCM 1650 / NBRC 105725 / CDC 9005-74) TaxID=630626 RepID=I2BCX1_SHIBC|nr:hypothetical protein EBL_c33120 [Shimwellia blattae DSM 4481 = NBRC 105725]GAB81069.1 hypothetical protein EB105725_11_01510 [Shimwellia blattae DSM 4481 = NBRC 105725]